MGRFSQCLESQRDLRLGEYVCGFLKAWEDLSSASVWGKFQYFSGPCQEVCLDEGILTRGEGAWGARVGSPVSWGHPLPAIPNC